MSEIVDFLLARLDEDEAVLPMLDDSGKQSTSRAWWSNDFEVVFIEEDRWRAEVEAKRRQVALLVEMDGHPQNVVGSYAHSLLCLLALPYADHEHYRREWRP